MEIEKLLIPISDENPCGPDLGYTSDFMSLEYASQGKPERRIGDTVVPAEEPDWTDIKQRAEVLFLLTKDLRIAMLLTKALIHCEGMVGFASGLELIKRMVTGCWEFVHPRPDVEDGDDPTMRLNVLVSLTDPDTLLRDIRSVKFIHASNHLQLSMRDLLASLGKLPETGSETLISQIEMGNIIRAPENENSLQAMRGALDALENIRVFLLEKVGVERAPDFQILSDMLKTVIPLGSISSVPEETPMSGSGIPTSFNDEIRSREDVIRMLEKISIFIERTEPANPASLLIRRAQSLMTKNFIEIIKDLAPQNLEQILRITGLDSDKK